MAFGTLETDNSIKGDQMRLTQLSVFFGLFTLFACSDDVTSPSSFNDVVNADLVLASVATLDGISFNGTHICLGGTADLDIGLIFADKTCPDGPITMNSTGHIPVTFHWDGNSYAGYRGYYVEDRILRNKSVAYMRTTSESDVAIGNFRDLCTGGFYGDCQLSYNEAEGLKITDR